MRRGYVVAVLFGCCVLGSLLVMRADAGPVLATSPAGIYPTGIAVDAQSGHAFVASNFDSSVRMIDTATGAQLRQVLLDRQFTGADWVGVDSAKRAVYVELEDGSLYTLDSQTGTPLHRAQQARTVPTIFLNGNHSCALVPSLTANIANLLDAQGQVRAQYALGLPPALQVARDERHARIFVLTGDAILRMLDTKTCALRWARLLPSTSSPLLYSAVFGRIDLLGESGALDDLDVRAGALLHTLRLGFSGAAGIQPAPQLLVDQDLGWVHVLAPSQGTITSINGRTGMLERVLPVPYPTAFLLNPMTHHLLVASSGPTNAVGDPLGAGSLQVLDVLHGEILRMVRLGIAPISLGYDRRTGHVLVVNAETNPDGTAVRPHTSSAVFLDQLRALASWLPLSPHTPVAHPEGSVIVLDARGL